jgi:hypothetical protein
MKGIWAGAGLAIGAALGLLFGQMMFDGSVWSLMIGAGVGLIVGAVVEALRSHGTDRDG